MPALQCPRTYTVGGLLGVELREVVADVDVVAAVRRIHAGVIDLDECRLGAGAVFAGARNCPLELVDA